MSYVITDETGRVVTTVPDSVAAHRATRRHGNVGSTVAEARVCAACKSPEGPGERELRPYGRGGSLVCYRCDQKSPGARRTARKAFGKRLADAGAVAVITRDGPKPLAGI